jgi:transcription initiation factor TFIID subunit 1, fungi type
VVEHAYPAQKLQLPFVRYSPFYCMVEPTSVDFFFSTKLAYPNKKHGPGIVRPCSFLSILNFVSARCGRRKRKKTSLAGRSVKAVTLAKGSEKRAICRYKTRAISSCGRFPLVTFGLPYSVSLENYQEEHPPIMSSFGMGSILVNYYRKKRDEDDHIPRVRLCPD